MQMCLWLQLQRRMMLVHVVDTEEQEISVFLYNHYWGSTVHSQHYPDGKVHGAIMGPIWVRQDPGVARFGSMNFALWVMLFEAT